MQILQEMRRNIWHSFGEDVSRKNENELVNHFNASISFDQRFYRQDIRGSIAHVTMLAKQKILTDEEKAQIVEGLEQILTDVENRLLAITLPLKIFTVSWRQLSSNESATWKKAPHRSKSQ